MGVNIMKRQEIERLTGLTTQGISDEKINEWYNWYKNPFPLLKREVIGAVRYAIKNYQMVK